VRVNDPGAGKFPGGATIPSASRLGQVTAGWALAPVNATSALPFIKFANGNATPLAGFVKNRLFSGIIKMFYK